MVNRKFLLLILIVAFLTGCSSVVRQRGPVAPSQPDIASVPEELAYSEADSLEAVLDEKGEEAQRLMSEIELAEEYYGYGVQANATEQWQEAQYNFEKSLSILSELNIDPDQGGILGYSYQKLLKEIRTEYKLTLLYLATVPGEASSSAFLDRFEEIEDFGKLKDESVVTDVDTKEEYDIPVVVNEKVENCIIYFQTLARDFFQQALTRSGKYTTLMSRILVEEGVPKDLVYLPMIESGFKTNAYSWASAVGPWQFISSTGRRYGLNRDWFHDERRDFEKSTRAAARYLKFLHERYNDWYLALAAYNGGEGRVDQVIRRHGTTDYWRLSKLKRETRDYVPLYLAATIIAKNPEKYGFEAYYDEPLRYETVSVDKCLDMYEVAGALGTTCEYLLELNPELLRKKTPAGKTAYQLRIPVSMSGVFQSNYANFKEAGSTTLSHHKIKSGETLSTIAKNYGISVRSLASANNLSTKQGLTEGKTILIPVPSGKSYSQKKSSKKKTEKSAPQYVEAGQYVVRKGDSLSDIADAHDISVADLRENNNLSGGSHIYPGQILNVKPSSRKATAGSIATGKKIASYKVREGDSLDKLASKHGISLNELATMNGMDNKYKLRTGQLINVPAAKSGKSRSGNPLFYVVKAGDTIWEIAKAFSCTVDDIIRLNNLKSNKISVGDRLKLKS